MIGYLNAALRRRRSRRESPAKALVGAADPWLGSNQTHVGRHDPGLPNRLGQVFVLDLSAPLFVEIGAASIMVCCPVCEAEARARILRRIHGSSVAALQRALSDWQKRNRTGRRRSGPARPGSRGGDASPGGSTSNSAGEAGPPGRPLARSSGVTKMTARAPVLKLAQEALRTARDRRHATLEAALGARIRALNHLQPRATTRLSTFDQRRAGHCLRPCELCGPCTGPGAQESMGESCVRDHGPTGLRVWSVHSSGAHP